MFLPMVVIHSYDVDMSFDNEGTRDYCWACCYFERGDPANLSWGNDKYMRTIVGAFGRTNPCTVTRRFVKFVGGVLLSSIVQESIDESNKIKQKPQKASFGGQLVSLLLGFGPG